MRAGTKVAVCITALEVLLALLAQLISLPAIAGTGAIFSPSGLPQSSNQNYSVPSPQVQGTTVTFPTPPLPLGGALQNFPSSTLPVSGTTSSGGTQGSTQSNSTSQGSTQSGSMQTGSLQPQPSTQQITVTPYKPPSTENGSIESFFQCAPAEPPPHKTSAPVKVIKTPGKLLWHILDNLGVPMFIGKDNDLDPSLTQTHFVPPGLIKEQNTSNESAPGIPNKIPESELEGTGVSPNDQIQAPPK